MPCCVCTFLKMFSFLFIFSNIFDSVLKCNIFFSWLKEQFRKADVNGNGSLNFEECLDLLNRLNIAMRRKEARKLFNVSELRFNDA